MRRRDARRLHPVLHRRKAVPEVVMAMPMGHSLSREVGCSAGVWAAGPVADQRDVYTCGHVILCQAVARCHRSCL